MTILSACWSYSTSCFSEVGRDVGGNVGGDVGRDVGGDGDSGLGCDVDGDKAKFTPTNEPIHTNVVNASNASIL